MLKRRPTSETFAAFGIPKKVHVQGPLGSIHVPIHSILDVNLENDDTILLSSKCGGNSKLGKSMWGITRTDIHNAVRGVLQGFRKDLELHGVGFRARLEPAGTVVERKKLERESLVLRLGFCNELVVPIPDNITIMVPSQTQITVLGFQKHRVGEVAASIKRLRKPDAYKGKGVRYAGEVVKLKQGKRK